MKRPRILEILLILTPLMLLVCAVSQFDRLWSMT